jgi:hypothetical protein
MAYNRVNIPWKLHGRVEDYADRKGMGLQEAYCHLLERGLPDDDAPR